MAQVKFDVYEEVTAKIITALEKGVKPWECPWQKGAAGMPLRSNGEAYRGINNLLLTFRAWEMGYANPSWMTFKQAKDLGGMVRKGEKSSLVVKYGTFETKGEDQDGSEAETRTRGYLKAYPVFNAEQIDGLDAEFQVPLESEGYNTRPIEQLSHIAVNMIENMGVVYAEGGDRAFYSPSLDKIQMPEICRFADPEKFSATLFHELAHATGHRTRCDRTKEKLGSKFGNASYAREELCAEICASFLGAQLGFKPDHIEDSAAYISSWLEVLRSDKRAIVRAAAAAQKASDYLLAHSVENFKAA